MPACEPTYSRPARSALLPQMVPAHVFTNAVTWNSSIFEVSSMAGPAIAGLVIAYASPVAAFVVSSILTLTYLVFLLLLRSRPAPSVSSSHADDGRLMGGIRFVSRTTLPLAPIPLDLFAVLLGGATYLLPFFADQILHVGPVGFGWLRAAPSIGAVSMALLLAHSPPLKHAGRTLLVAVAGF